MTEASNQAAIEPAGEAELRTFLFADIRGYTRFTVEHGDEAAGRLTAIFAGLAREASTAHGGYVHELVGDEVVAIFGSARNALRAAVDLQVRCIEAAREDPSLPFRVGIGIDAGEAVRTEGGYRGTALNLASRLCSLAGPTEILASEGVIHLARKTEGLIYSERGLVELKGFVEPVRVIQVLSENALFEEADEEATPELVPQPSLPIGAFLGALPPGPLVGREDEIAHLEPVLDAVETGSGQLVIVSGEVGVGKTRLAQEISKFARDRGFLVVAGRCFESERDSPLFPFLEALPSAFNSAPATIRARVQRQWPQLRRLLPEQVSAIGVEQEEDGQTLFRAATAFFSAIADQRPVAIFIDDLQWADEGALRLLQHLARHTRNKRVLLFGTYQEGELIRDSPLDRVLRELARERLIDRMTLRRLATEGTATMVAEAVGDMEGAEEFAEFVHRRTKGNPALVEEMLRTLGGRYRLVRQVGSGGMGRVFQAVDTKTGKVVAAKILFASSEADLDALLRFQQEGAVLSTLKHPNIVQVYGTFMEEHTSCIIMELLEGKSLRQVLEEEHPNLERIKAIAGQAAKALAYAHGKSIVHRDVKPDNIMVMPGDQVKVTDFGIARILRPGGTLNTMTGMTLGTPLYMAPEQIEGGSVDGRSDVYSLGAVLYQALAGRPPFEGDDPITVAFRQVQEAPVPPSSIREGVPADWEELVLKALSKDPSDRYPSAAAFERAIAGLSLDASAVAAVSAASSPANATEEAPPEGKQSRLRVLTPPGGATTPSGSTSSRKGSTPVEPASAATKAETLGKEIGEALEPLGDLVEGQVTDRLGQIKARIAERIETKRAERRNVREALDPATILRLIRIPAPIVAVAVIAFLVLHSLSGGSTSASSFVMGHADAGWKVHTNTLPFNYPDGVAVSSQDLGQSIYADTIYVADRLNHRIARIAADGTPLTAWGSEGTGDGQFERPGAVAVDPADGTVYVADTGNSRMQEFTAGGRFVTAFGTSGKGQLNQPTDVALARPASSCPTCLPNLYVVDSGNDRLVEFSPDGNFLGEYKPTPKEAPQSNLQKVAVASTGAVYVSDGGNNQIDVLKHRQLQHLFGSAGLVRGKLSGPDGIAVDGYGNVYVADSANNRIQRFDRPHWKPQVWASSVTLSNPKGLAIDGDGNLYVADSANNLLRKFAPDGALSHSWNGAFTSHHSILGGPVGLATDQAGNVYVADSNKDRVAEIAPDGSLLAAGGKEGNLPGEYSSPVAVALDKHGDVYVADSLNNRVQNLGSISGQLSTATFSNPSGLAASNSETLYVADTGDERIVELATGDGSTIRFWPSRGGGGPANGQFQGPFGLALDAHGNVYVVDQGNNRVQVFSSKGKFLFALGTSGPGAGSPQPGQFRQPYGVAVDAQGDVYVADTGNNRVEEFNPRHALIATVTGLSSKDRFNNPEGVAVDAKGNVYVSDNSNNRIVKIAPS